MRVRGALLALLLVPALAGCLSPQEPAPGLNEAETLLYLDAVAPGQYESHPAYGYPTDAMLPISDDGVHRKVLPDGSIQWYRPVAVPLPDPIRGMEGLAHVEGTSTGGGIAVFGPLAFIGHRTEGPLLVVDISAPAAPRVVGSAEDAPVRDADPILYPDGRLVVVTTAGGSMQFVTDVTDPTEAFLLTAFETEHGNHNIAVVPGTPLVYNSGTSGTIDIMDYSDPESPVALGAFENGQGCHDITFHIDRAEERYRAYCAGYEETQIWDIADPARPVIVTRLPYPGMEQGLPGADGVLPESGAAFPLSFSHLAMVNHDATVLIMGDETGGGGMNGCDVYAEIQGSTVSGPIGNLWFYDVRNEAQPVLRGHVSPAATDAESSCTAHFGRLIEDTGLLVMGFYSAGVVLVDFNDPAAPRITARLDQEGSIWDVWYHQGFLLTGDMSRGMDVIRLV